MTNTHMREDLRTIARLFFSACFLASVLISPAFAQYVSQNLVANTRALHPRFVDPNLIDGWGLANFPTSPFWVSDQNTSKSTLYNANGVLRLLGSAPFQLAVQIPCVVSGSPTVPCPLPGQGKSFPSTLFGPTGLIANIFAGAGDFQITQNSTSIGPALFIWATLDGLIVAWNLQVMPLTQAVVTANRSSAGAIYTGLAAAGPPAISASFLYGANAAGEIDVFDMNFKLVNSFAADSSPGPFTPYGIRAIGDKLYVTYAVPPPIAFGGIVDVCDLSMSATAPTCVRLREDGPSSSPTPSLVLNGPWGLAVAPSDFGPLSNMLLVGNVNDGHINGLDPGTGAIAMGSPLTLTDGQTFALPGLWALQFGAGLRPVNGRANQLFFTGGPGRSPAQIFSEGVLGVISPAPPS